MAGSGLANASLTNGERWGRFRNHHGRFGAAILPMLEHIAITHLSEGLDARFRVRPEPRTD
ncbi:MAG: hypothetical protein EA417_19400 [Gammaproteobacteria bacterium]|nr:MAG: hypothetical protein EA417_19400 [Gammaproteobacteria bacterium]